MFWCRMSRKVTKLGRSTTAEDRPARDTAEAEQERPAAEAPPAKRPARRRGRASVPSWDEIMFGGGKGE